MATINWRKVLDSNNIEYIEKGKSVAKNNIYVKCPFCGNADSGHHMGLQTETSWWGCWRNKSHRGKSPVRLLMALLRVSHEVALSIAGLDEDYSDPDGYESIKHNLFKKNVAVEEQKEEKVLCMPDDFIDITKGRLRTERHFNYLVSRGFDSYAITTLTKEYGIKAAVSGPFKDRIILPYNMARQLVSWTGRAFGGASLRYMDLSVDESIVHTKKTLYNYNAARRQNKVLLVAEGPFDAIKLDLFGKDYGVRTVALSTNSITDQQTYVLEEVAINFERVLMIMDNGNSTGLVDSYRIKESLNHIPNIGFTTVPQQFKDGGEMPKDEVIKFVKSLTN